MSIIEEIRQLRRGGLSLQQAKMAYHQLHGQSTDAIQQQLAVAIESIARNDALVGVMDTTLAVVEQVFGSIEITLNSESVKLVIPRFGLEIEVVELREIEGKAVPVFQLSQLIRVPGAPDGEVVHEIDEIGDYIHWNECLRKVCEVIAACRVQEVLDALEAEKATKEWQGEMDRFYDERVERHGQNQE